MNYVFKRPLRSKLIIKANNSLTLWKECRNLLGWRRSARLKYKQIGSNSFRIENRFGLTVADIYKII